MVHLIWKRRRPKLDELQHFKSICYDVYFQFTTTGKVDHDLFNKSIKQYQLQQFNFDDYDTKIVPPNDNKVFLHDEGNYVNDEYLLPDSKPDLDTKELNHVLKLSHNIDTFEQEITLFINHQKSTSTYFDSLIKLVGFGRIMNIFKILLQAGNIKLHSIYEYKIVEIAFYYGLHQHIISATNYYDCENCDSNCNKHLRYFYICESCLSVNRHNRYDRDKNIPLDQKVCKNFTWFGKQGKIIESKFSKLYYKSIEIDNRIIDPTTNLDYYSILHNLYSAEQKQKLVEEDKILKEMETKQLETRKFSGIMLNNDIIERKNKLLSFNKKDEVFLVPKTFSSLSPTDTLTETLPSDDKYIEALPSPLFTQTTKSVTYEAGDICPDCESEFKRAFGSIKCKCRSISTSFSGFSFLQR
jgi:hypothetical protein